MIFLIFQKLLGDPVRFNQIIMNLVSNAIKFTAHGSVVVRAKNISSSPHSTTIEVSVKDTGIGIEHSKFPVIFESFTQASSDTTRKFGGTGLGLSIAKK